MRFLRPALTAAALLVLLAAASAQAQGRDTDGDGLDDVLEQALLTRFAPVFLVGREDCAGAPAEFRPGLATPTVVARNGTVYGQVSPAKSQAGHPLVDIRFYHLWAQDCGPHGHPLDTEHVSVLVRASGSDLTRATWTALFWYAAAHENTVCDVSQIARASTLHAEDRGARIWISHGKHASYLNETLCKRGCGSDRCERMTPLATGSILNLGEPGHPMNGAVFVSSEQWPLAAKMHETNFPEASIDRLNQLPETDIAWFSPGRHPAQGIIAVSSSTEQALAGSGQSTATAITVAGNSTGGALGKSLRATRHALATSARRVGDAVHVSEPSDKPE